MSVYSDHSLPEKQIKGLGDSANIYCYSDEQVKWAFNSKKVSEDIDLWNITSKNFPDDIELHTDNNKYVYTLHIPKVSMMHYGTYTCYGKLLHQKFYFYSTSTISPSGKSHLNLYQ